jgi:hypothetical protein
MGAISTLTNKEISEYNLIKWCQWDHLIDRILMGLRVRAAGLKVFMVSIKDLVCQLCIGCSLSLSNNGTMLCVITDIFGLSYSFWLVPRLAEDKNTTYILFLSAACRAFPPFLMYQSEPCRIVCTKMVPSSSLHHNRDVAKPLLACITTIPCPPLAMKANTAFIAVGGPP